MRSGRRSNGSCRSPSTSIRLAGTTRGPRLRVRTRLARFELTDLDISHGEDRALGATHATMLEWGPTMQSVSIHNKFVASGFDGGYTSVVSAVREFRGPRLRAADVVSRVRCQIR